jgi:hypothetical protein
MTEHAPDLEATDARQARKGRRVFLVLAVSLALVVVALGAMVLSHARPLAGHGGQTTAPAQVARNVDTEPSTMSQTAATAPPGSVAAQSASQNNTQSAGG